MADRPARLVARFDDWTLLRGPLELRRRGEPVRLQEQPLQVLEALLERPGELVSRDELTARLWPDTVVDFDAGLNTAVRKLRAVLDDDADAPKYLETVPRQGYRFVGTLSGVEPAMAAPSAAPAANAARPKGSWRFAALGAAGLAAAGAFTVMANRLPPAAPPEAAAPAPASSRLAVLPFENLSPDPANAFFADGMHSELVSALGSQVPRLEVISRTTMLAYRQTSPAIGTLARELGATHVLEGTVRREAGSVRVSVQLVDAKTDRQVWAQSYQRTLVDAMTLQVDIAQQVAEQLAVQLPVARASHPPPRNPEAYDYWLKGTLAWQQVGGGGATAQEIDRVEAMFTRAIELDDRYAAAYADRGRVRVARYVSHADASEANVAAARSDIALAQKYGGGTPHLLVRAASLAFLVDRDLPRALGLIEAAEQVGPLNADLLLTKGNFLMFAGRVEESLRVQAHAARLDPGNAGIYRYWVGNLMAAHRPAEAMEVLREFDARYPGRLDRGEYLFAFTGVTTRWWEEVARLRERADPTSTLSAEFDLLRYEGRFDDLRRRLAAAGDATFTHHGPFGARVGASGKPVAELRGWERLLAGDRRAAAAEGAILAAFTDRLPKVPRNEWWRRLLAAESGLMAGDEARAIEQARTMLALVRQGTTSGESVHGRLVAARVLAWAGAHDDAVLLLEHLAGGYPGVGPAVIVRDPLLNRPLAAHPRWRALETSLRGQIAANQRLLD